MILVICLCASSISCISMYSFYKTGIIGLKPFATQVIAVVLGAIAACVISSIDYVILAKLWKIYTPFALFLVLLTFTPLGITPADTDDKAWLNLGVTTLQPSELLKLAFIFTFSLHLVKVGENINKPKDFLKLCIHGAIPTLLIVKQGDLGSALVFFAIFVAMMFAGGLSLKFIAVGITGGVVAAPLIWNFLLPAHLQKRFLVALHPETDILDKGMQQYKGRIALGSGGLDGRGLFFDNLFNVPKAHNDFIFSYIGQTLGFVGCIITLLIIVALCVKILLTARMAKDNLGMYICIGVFAIYLFQSIVNIGMVLCVLPVIGITLPLFSSGGTSVLVSYMAIGMVMSVYRVNKKEMMFD
ncbi:FtsW/RodA/SpoVE family cell cycle protein [Paludicola sp. MB14-C6]|uniref:FtsW/RodA/SpoVE family cell cycle protein n=1 Tax=Paludihabitans sp. MB14-C6 TaxID=3070656 RepID=UPI0027DB0266|nr:FtsW/RodA/SpoVE family cell cycle protein [Paludicola sp. MB14-C6]WMJ23608.1 FtsW/RodA/SpoVE family cell cycle protein [Paludicola sp. MB14-C6]